MIVGAKIGGLVEEEHNNQITEFPDGGEVSLLLAQDPAPSGFIGHQLGTGDGNEDNNDQTANNQGPTSNGNDQDVDGNPNNTTLVVTGTGTNSLAALFSGGDLPLHFAIDGFAAVGTTAKDGDGNVVQSLGHPVEYSFYFDGLTFDYIEASSDGRLVFTLTVNDDGTWQFVLYDQLDHLVDTIDDGTNPIGILEDTLGIDLSALIIGEDNNGTDLPLLPEGTFVVDVIDDTPIAIGEPITRTVDEDDIDTPWSLGTSPDDGTADGSETENPGGPVNPAYIEGSLASLVRIGADEVPYGQPIFSFTEDAVAKMTALGLIRKTPCSRRPKTACRSFTRRHRRVTG